MPKRLGLLIVTILIGFVLVGKAVQQSRVDLQERFRRMSDEYEAEGWPRNIPVSRRMVRPQKVCSGFIQQVFRLNQYSVPLRLSWGHSPLSKSLKRFSPWMIPSGASG